MVLINTQATWAFTLLQDLRPKIGSLRRPRKPAIDSFFGVIPVFRLLDSDFLVLHDKFHDKILGDKVDQLQSTHARALFDTTKDGFHPGRVFAILKHIKALPETEVAHYVERRAVVHLEDINLVAGKHSLMEFALHFLDPMFE